MPPSNKRVTIRDIALAAKVSHGTVSRALRNLPIISKATRDRIKLISKKLGYVPDPALHALASYRIKNSTQSHRGELAWINTHKTPESLYSTASFKEYWEGAHACALQQGYNLEEFCLAHYDMRMEALFKVLRARNIQGLILPPQERNRAHLKLPWEYFSFVSLGYSLVYPKTHIITNAQFRSCVTAFRGLRAEGYRKIGYVSGYNIDERTDHNFLGGYTVEQRRLSPQEIIPPYLPSKSYDEVLHLQEFADWYAKHRPEAIIIAEWIPPDAPKRWGVYYWMRRLGISQRKCQIATLSLPEGEKRAPGIHQNNRLIGKIAVDQVVGMIYRNERGIPESTFHILVEGKWMRNRIIRKTSARYTGAKKPKIP